MHIMNFFKDKSGNIVIGQKPNAPIVAWFIAMIGARIPVLSSVQGPLQIIATVSLSIWAVLEITQGVTIFRRVLGATVMLFIVVNLIT